MIQAVFSRNSKGKRKQNFYKYQYIFPGKPYHWHTTNQHLGKMKTKTNKLERTKERKQERKKETNQYENPKKKEI